MQRIDRPPALNDPNPHVDNQGFTMTTIAIVTLEDFNEIDTFLAFNILNRVNRPEWDVHIAAPTHQVISMNGVTVTATMDLESACRADAVIIGSSRRSSEHANDEQVLTGLRQLDPARQRIASQCSGALLLHKLDLIGTQPICTDEVTRPKLEPLGVEVLHQPFHSSDRIATAGGCLAAPYLAAWIIGSLSGIEDARQALLKVAPAGREEETLSDILDQVFGQASVQ